jgi:hypothetical protein
MSQAPTLPLTIKGRSPLSESGFRWGGAGSLILGLACAFGAGGVAGIFFGILFIMLAIATWGFSLFGTMPWDRMSAAGRVLAGTGSVIGVAFLLILVLWLVAFFWVFKVILGWMAE